MAATLAIGMFVILMAVISVAGYRRYARPSRIYDQLGGQAATFTMPSVHRTDPDDPGLLVTVLQQIGEKIPVNPDDVTMTRGDLIAAGFRSERALPVYVGTRILASVVLVVLALVFRHDMTSNSVLAIVIPVAAGFLGYFGPSFYLDHLVTARQERIRLSLPDALDLMVVSVEAGLALDQSIQYVGKELEPTHPDISEEFQLINLEIRAGKRRTEALRNIAERTREPEVRKLIAILIQTDRFGTSVAESLRTHSDFMRTRRRQEAEERAGKVGVKLVFPIFFLILPSMLVVAAGPGLLQVFKYLFPMMKQFSQGQ
jgi:tight adherence protein C